MKQLIGIDGGGTSTKATLYEYAPGGVGQALRYAESGPSNLNSNSPEQVRANLAELYAALNPEEAVAVGLGVAGITTPGVTEQLTQFLEEIGYPKVVVIVGDYESALRGAFDREPGVLLIAGTGSIAYGQARDGRLHRAGGYGHLISDGGSAYSIGQALLSAYVKAYDGSIEKTALLQALEDQLGKTPQEALDALMSLAYKLPFDKARIAALARLQDAFLAKRDPLALKIAREGAEELRILIDTVAKPLGEEKVELALAGGMLLHNPEYRLVLEETLKQSDLEYEVTAPRADAMAGAADLAREAYSAS